MGDQALISYQLVKKIYPARKFIIIASAIFIVLSLLIVLESAFMFTSTTRVGNPVLVIFSYLLAWFLIMVGLMGLKIACLANTLNTTVRSLSNTSSGRPGSAPAWISSPEMAPDIIPEFDLPGTLAVQ
ncbi:hypothetical protein AAVH_00126 [Aphelenchoides avenae]|nr:hypothetical protein AAVH_00126 [Aphelenchus avenae]